MDYKLNDVIDYFFEEIFNGIGYKKDLPDCLTEELDIVIFDKDSYDEIVLNVPELEFNGTLYPAKVFRFRKDCDDDTSLDYHCEGVYEYSDEMKLTDLDTNQKYKVYVSYCNDNITSVEVCPKK